jgi:hypothetical protein
MRTNLLLGTVLIFVAMSGIACAAIEEDWAHERRNVAPEGIEHTYWDFEEGSNLMPFNNQHPTIAAFMNVVTSYPENMFGTDEPSYVCKGGRGMHIYPYDYYKNPDGTPVDFIYIVNGRSAFAPRTGPDILGKYWPGMESLIVFKDDTHYISFLVSTGSNLYIRLYDSKNNVIHYEHIECNTDRTGSEPPEFTRFSVNITDKQIAAMKLQGSFNAWHIDDLIVGGAPAYPEERRDYGYAAERLKEIAGAKYLEHGRGYDPSAEVLYPPDRILNEELLYWDPDTKEFLFGEGRCDEGAIIWAFNVDDDLVNWAGIDGQIKHDFTEHVEYGQHQPGDVFFIDYNADGCYDEVGMVIFPETIGDSTFDIIRIIPETGVSYDQSALINAVYSDGVAGTVEYQHLPDAPKGGHSPYPKIPGKFVP